MKCFVVAYVGSAALVGGFIVWVCSWFGATATTKLILGSQGGVVFMLLVWAAAIIWGRPLREDGSK